MRKHYRSLAPLIPWKEVKRPIDWADAFGREAPLEVEIGFGKGEYLVRLGSQYPERNFVGVELAWGSVRRALACIDKAKLLNIRVILADTRVAFDRLFAPDVIDRVYSLFPMPWPKERHMKHRVFSHTFLRVLNSRLKKGGVVQIISDYKPYILWVINELPDTGFTAESRVTPPVFATKYERRWHEGGQKEFFELLLSKHEHTHLPLKEDIPLRTYAVPHFNPENFIPRNERGEVAVEFKDFLYDPERRRGMVRVMVNEDNVTQHFWIEIALSEGQWHIHVAQGCGILPTVGVQKALDLVRDATVSEP